VNKFYNEEHFNFLTENLKKMTVRDLTKAFNTQFGTDKTVIAIKTILSKNGIKSNRKKGKWLWKPETLLTEKEKAFLAKKYKRYPLKECLQMLNKEFNLNIKLNQIRAYVKNNNIKSGRTGQFKPGNIPWTQGKKGFMGANKTSFKKGQLPHNTRPLYSERIDKNGYIEIKVPEQNPYTKSKTRWRQKSVFMWEKYNNQKVKKNERVIFKDSNNRNFSKENLIKITAAEHLALNTIGGADIPLEIKDVAITTAKIKAKIWEKRKDL
jgi:hypothetical protein